MKILIVEPDAHKHRQLRTILTSLGHKSADIEGAIDKRSMTVLLRKRRFDFMFLDMQTEAGNSVEMLKGIRGGVSTRTLPVIMFSAEVTKDSVMASHEAGANGFLAYPFSVSDVENAMLTCGKK